MLDPESGGFHHLRKMPGCSGPSSEKRSRTFPVLELYGLLQRFGSGTNSRNFGYSLKEHLRPFYNEVPVRYKEEEFLFFLLFGRMLTELAFCARSSRNTQGSVYLKKRSAILTSIIWKTFDIPAISAYAGINKSYLQALFTKKNGCTINTYINRKRMEQAAFLVQQYSAHYGYCLFFRIQQPAAFCTYLRKISSYEPLQGPKPSYPAFSVRIPKRNAII